MRELSQMLKNSRNGQMSKKITGHGMPTKLSALALAIQLSSGIVWAGPEVEW